MAKNKEYEMAIKIAGEIEKSFYDATKLTKKELSDMAKHAAKTVRAVEGASGSSEKMSQKFRKSLSDAEPVFTGMERAAVSSFKAVASAAAVTGTAVAAGLGVSIVKGSEFESAFAGVKKTVNATDAELAQMRDDIREMAKEMPTSAAGLSEIAESAGQLGIQTENIAEFTKTMADLEVATNLTREEGAADFAKFANITKMQQDHFDELGSSVVALGNNMATTEADTVAMAMRIAAAGTQVRLSQADIMAYAASLSSVGIEAEAGGSAFSKLLVNMQMAAETGKNLKDYAKVAGMTGEQFKEAFQQDATAAINAFLSGLNDTERNGKSAIAVLDDMGIKEVRLRDTLLRAANASDMFADALRISNTAWEENVALSNEAEQRYATFESQMDILGNKVTDVGISVYDDLKPGLTETVKLANEFVDSVAGKEDAFGDMIESATKKMPTMVRQVREAGEAVGEFAEPFLAVGGWLVDNPGLLVGTIAGAGTALTTYKVASGVMSLAGSLAAMGPAGATILGIGGVAAVVTGIGVSVKKSADAAKKANLDAHFGDIALSLSDLQEVAGFIVKSKSLDKINQSVKAMSELEGISEQIQDASEAVSKMNWKVSIGMELTDQEKQAYQEQVQSFVESTQEYVTQQQYAVSLSIGTLVQDDLESSNIVSQVNQFYADKQGELAALGTELNETITEAFRDGLLDMDEVEEISKLQEQIAHIKSALAGSDFEAGLDLIATKYGGQQLDADSFQNLQAEIQGQMEKAISSYDEAYTTSMSQLRLMRSEGGMTQEEFQTAADSVQSGYLQQKTDLQAKAVRFQMDTIRQAYGEELDSLMGQLEAETAEELGQMLSNVASGNAPNVHLDEIGKQVVSSVKGDIDKSTQDALGDLYEQMQPQLEQMKQLADQYREAGKAVPAALQKSISDASAIGGLSGDADAMWGVIGQTAQSEEYAQMITTIQEAGGYVPEEIANAIADNQDKIDTAVQNSHIATQRIINETFGKWKLKIPIDISPNVRSAPYSQEYIKQNVKEGHAEGGIFDQPHVAWFAENGPEAAIPLDRSANAISLWLKTGELLGMDGLTGGSEPLLAGVENASYMGAPEVNISYSPQLYFSESTASREKIEEIMESEQDKFSRMMSQWIKENARSSFAR